MKTIDKDKREIYNPCIGFCYADQTWGKYCLGCKRWIYEVQHWDMFSDERKLEILRRLDDLRAEDREDYPEYK